MKKGNFETFLVRDAVYTFGFVYDDKYREDGKRPLSFKLSKQDLRDLHSILSELLETETKTSNLGFIRQYLGEVPPERRFTAKELWEVFNTFAPLMSEETEKKLVEAIQGLETETVKGECVYCCKHTELFRDGHCEKCWYKVHPSETVKEPNDFAEKCPYRIPGCPIDYPPSNSEKEECPTCREPKWCCAFMKGDDGYCDSCRPKEEVKEECRCRSGELKTGGKWASWSKDNCPVHPDKSPFDKEEPTIPEKQKIQCLCPAWFSDGEGGHVKNTRKDHVKGECPLANVENELATPEKKPSEKIGEILCKIMDGYTHPDDVDWNHERVNAVVAYLDEQHKKK